MSSTCDLVLTEIRGGTIGKTVSDVPPSGDLSTSTIIKIVLQADSACVHGLEVLSCTLLVELRTWLMLTTSLGTLFME